MTGTKRNLDSENNHRTKSCWTTFHTWKNTNFSC